MSPGRARFGLSRRRFPRVSGDEPRAANVDDMRALFSPRERG